MDSFCVFEEFNRVDPLDNDIFFLFVTCLLCSLIFLY